MDETRPVKVSGVRRGVSFSVMALRRLLVAGLLSSAIAVTPRATTLAAAQAPLPAKTVSSQYGPPNGTLFIAGGSTFGLPIALINKFIELGGGVDGKFVIVPTGMGRFDGIGQDRTVRVYVESQVLGPWLEIEVIDTDADGAIDLLRVYLRRSYGDTLVWESRGDANKPQ